MLRLTFIGFGLIVWLGACNSWLQIKQLTPQLQRLEIIQDAPQLGKIHQIRVKGFDHQGHHVFVEPKKLRWQVKDPNILRMDTPGFFTPLKAGQTSLLVSTQDGQVYSEQPEVILPSQNLEALEQEISLGAHSAPEHSYNQLNLAWNSYVGNTFNRFGQPCRGIADDCGQCVGFAKAFGNNTPYNVPSQTWFSEGPILTRGPHPRLQFKLQSGDAIATMKPHLGKLRYSYADFRGPGHVALFSQFLANEQMVRVAVRDQNYTAPLQVGYHSFLVPKVNGVPYCSAVRTTDPANICNYDKVKVGGL